MILQINWTDIQYTSEEMGRSVYEFPLHIRVLFAITLLLVALILSLLFVVISSRIIKTNHEIRRRRIKDKYIDIFHQILFGDEAQLEGDRIFELIDKKDLRNLFNREVILETLVHLHESFSGETVGRLEKTYQNSGLYLHSLKRLKHRRWDMKALGLRELSRMNTKSAIPQIEPFIQHSHEILRYEARVALMKLSETDHLSFLDHEKGILSDWDQANIYTMLTRMPKEAVPDFSRWFEAKNPSVVEFAISMTGAFQQTQSLPKLLRMMDEASERQRLHIIRTFVRCNNASIEQYLIERFPSETETVQNEIIQSIAQIGTSKSTDFLERILKKPQDDISQTVFILRSLLHAGDRGQLLVEELSRKGSDRMRIAVAHAKDQRL